MDAIGSAGGQLVGWNDSTWECVSELVGTYILRVTLRQRASNKIYTFSSVYGTCYDPLRDVMWSELRSTEHWASSSWIVGGDFNITRVLGERSGNENNIASMTKFNDIINNLELYEPPLTGRRYTWSNNRSPPTLAKLDRFLVSTNWEREFPLLTASIGTRHVSDHSPILLDTRSTLGGKPPFRFEKAWLAHNDLHRVVKRTWDSVRPHSHDAGGTFVHKLSMLRKVLKMWSRETFGNLGARKSAILEEIDGLEKLSEGRRLSTSEISVQKMLMADLQEILRAEETKWSQRSREKWL